MHSELGRGTPGGKGWNLSARWGSMKGYFFQQLVDEPVESTKLFLLEGTRFCFLHLNNFSCKEVVVRSSAIGVIVPSKPSGSLRQKKAKINQ